MGLSSWAVALCFLAGLHSHPITELVEFVGDHEQTLNGIPALSGDFPYLCVLHLNGYFVRRNPNWTFPYLDCSSLFTWKKITNPLFFKILNAHAITEVGKFSAVLNSLAIDGSSTGAVIRGVKYFIIHEQYNPSYKDNDIAILILSSPVTNLSFATLPTDSTTKATTINATTTKTHTTTPKPTKTKEKLTTTETLKSKTDQQNITTKKANPENIFTSTSKTKTSASTTTENSTSDSDLVPLSNIFSGLLAIKWTTTERPTTKTTIMTTPHTTTTPISTNATPTAENLTSGSNFVPLSNIFSSLLAIKSTTTQRPTPKTTFTTTSHTTENAISTIATTTEEIPQSDSDLVPLSNIFSSNFVPLSNIFSSLLAIKSTTTQRPTPQTTFTTTPHTTVNAISTVATTTAENPTTGSDLVPLSNIFSSLLAIKTTTTQTPATATKTTVTPNTKTPSKTSTSIIATTTAEGKPTSDNDLVPLGHFFSNTSAISAFSTFANSPAIIAGWGTTSLGANLSKVLLKVDVIIRDNSFCKGRYDSSFIDADLLCASTSGTHNCQVIK
uniref:Peptidase S1 domain-containing protein n=1 Tax=Daphnia galeata TaxID=27404 RepID=A0A8J2RM56_9CRUS|nr:unnamed protein product [Daphnia galeata]